MEHFSRMTAPLPSTLRNLLARTIQQARRTGEAGARQVLQSLAVDRAKPVSNRCPSGPSHSATAFGCAAGKPGTGSIGKAPHPKAGPFSSTKSLTSTGTACCSRASWPRTGSSEDAEHGVHLSLEDCRELADGEGVDPWEFAARVRGTNASADLPPGRSGAGTLPPPRDAARTRTAAG